MTSRFKLDYSERCPLSLLRMKTDGGSVMNVAAKLMKGGGCILLGLLCLSHPGWASQDVRPGLWEITVRSEMADAPGKDALLPRASEHCIADKDDIPRILQENRGCRISDARSEGHEAFWKMKCRDQGSNIQGSGRISYRVDLFEGTVHLRIKPARGEPIKLIQRIRGKRIGDCP